MEDTGWRDFSTDPLTPLQRTLLSAFMREGYHGASIRSLAVAAGLSVPGLYHHYGSKQAILVDLLDRAMSDLYARSSAALADAGADPVSRLDLLVECLVLFHAHEGDLAFLAADEIRALEPAARTRHVAARDRQQRLLDAIVEEGTAIGLFHAPLPREGSRAIVSMCTGVAQWFRTDGPKTPEQFAHLYAGFARGLLGVREA